MTINNNLSSNTKETLRKNIEYMFSIGFRGGFGNWFGSSSFKTGHNPSCTRLPF